MVDADMAGLSYNDALQMASMASMQDMSYAPPAMQTMIQQCLQTQPGPRPSIMDYLACEFFHDMQAKCLQFLEAFPEKDKATKAQFLKQLTTHLEAFERRVLQQKVLPTLLDECRDLELVQFLLPNILMIVRDMSQPDFEKKVRPRLILTLKLEPEPQPQPQRQGGPQDVGGL